MCNVWTLTLSLLTKVNEDMTIVCVGFDRCQILIVFEVLRVCNFAVRKTSQNNIFDEISMVYFQKGFWLKLS